MTTIGDYGCLLVITTVVTIPDYHCLLLYSPTEEAHTIVGTPLEVCKYFLFCTYCILVGCLIWVCLQYFSKSFYLEPLNPQQPTLIKYRGHLPIPHHTSLGYIGSRHKHALEDLSRTWTTHKAGRGWFHNKAAQGWRYTKVLKFAQIRRFLFGGPYCCISWRKESRVIIMRTARVTALGGRHTPLLKALSRQNPHNNRVGDRFHFLPPWDKARFREKEAFPSMKTSDFEA